MTLEFKTIFGKETVYTVGDVL